MILKTDILNALNKWLLTWYPERKVYRDTVPKDFARPSFALAAGKRKSSAAGRCMIDVQQDFSVLCCVKPNANGIASTDELQEIGDRLLQLLVDGGLRVGDRFLDLESLTDERTAEDELTVRGTFAYRDSRDIADDTPVADTITLNLKGG